MESERDTEMESTVIPIECFGCQGLEPCFYQFGFSGIYIKWP